MRRREVQRQREERRQTRLAVRSARSSLIISCCPGEGERTDGPYNSDDNGERERERERESKNQDTRHEPRDTSSKVAATTGGLLEPGRTGGGGDALLARRFGTRRAVATVHTWRHASAARTVANTHAKRQSPVRRSSTDSLTAAPTTRGSAATPFPHPRSPPLHHRHVPFATTVAVVTQAHPFHAQGNWISLTPSLSLPPSLSLSPSLPSLPQAWVPPIASSASRALASRSQTTKPTPSPSFVACVRKRRSH